MTHTEAVLHSAQILSLAWAVLGVSFALFTPAIAVEVKEFKPYRWFITWILFALLCSIIFVFTSTGKTIFQ